MKTAWTTVHSPINYLFNGEDDRLLGFAALDRENVLESASGAADCAFVQRQRELQHMADVKRATSLAFALAIISAVGGFCAIMRLPAGTTSDWRSK